MARSGIEVRNTDGCRISLQCYLDPTIGVRKEILNSLRNGGAPETQQVPVASHSFGGVSTATPATYAPDAQLVIERSLGMSLGNIRSTLFGRGANSSGFLLTAGRLAGVELVSKEDLRQALDLLYEDLCKFIDGEHQTCDSPANLPSLPELSITED